MCREIFDYKIHPSRHLHKKLRKQIIKKLENECGRIHQDKITELFIFLNKKNINVPFLTKMFNIVNSIKQNCTEDNYILENNCEWMEYKDGAVVIHEHEYCHFDLLDKLINFLKM